MSKRTQRVLLFIAMLWAGPLAAGHYYMATNGSDGYPGTLQAPWATFNHAIWQLTPGDTLLVRGGRYDEGEVWIRKARGMGGADGRYVTLMAYPGETVELDGERLMIVDANYIRIQGFTFRNTYSLRMPYTGSPDARNYVEVLNNRFVGNFLIPLEFSGNHSLIEGNIFENSNGLSHAIYLHYGRDNIVRRNRILGTYKYGIHVFDEHKDGDEPGFVREYHNILIEENYVANCKTRACIILGTSADSPTPGVIMDSVIIRRNIIANNGTHGIYIKAWNGRISHVEICNNTLYNNAADGIMIVNAQDIRIYNNLPNDIVRQGQTLIIPLCDRLPTAGPTLTPTPLPPYPAPNLLLPRSGTAFTAQDQAVTLQWASVASLYPGEVYRVMIQDLTSAEEKILVDYVSDTKFILPASFRPTDTNPHIIQWSVSVARQINSDPNNPIYEEAGAISAYRVFSWVGSGISPTATP